MAQHANRMFTSYIRFVLFKKSVMADTTSYSLSSSEDPFLYCQECSDTSHKGRKCRHSLHTIVNIDEVSVII